MVKQVTLRKLALDGFNQPMLPQRHDLGDGRWPDHVATKGEKEVKRLKYIDFLIQLLAGFRLYGEWILAHGGRKHGQYAENSS